MHITKIPNKPIGQGYDDFSTAEKGYVWEIHTSLNLVGEDPAEVESCLLKPIDTWKMVHDFIR